LTIQWAKDVARSLDYLETRSDVDASKVAFLGLSMGANDAPNFLAVDPRFKAAVTMAGGLTAVPRLPEVDSANFAPYVHTPFLMINGRQDFMRQYESSQLALYNLLGLPESDKRLASYDGGHLPPRAVMIKETLDWLDRYLGAVQTH
jgi:dienelactone hydrolase